MPKYGSRPDMERREQVARLRAKGLKLREIADRLGCSNQRVHQILARERRTHHALHR
jgi:DNA-binding NarL/FixJ family response regulator